MKKIIFYLFVVTFLNCTVLATSTSTVTRNVSIDGSVTTASANGDNDGDWEPDESLTGSDGVTWYMTWDDNNLYIGKTGGNINEQHLIYIQAEYTGSQYSSTPITYDQFTPDFTNMTGINFNAYLKTSYDEFRTWNGTSWSSANTTLLPSFGTDFEVKIPWNDISAGNGKPTHFRILFYQVWGNPGGYYGASPTGNPNNGTNPDSPPTIVDWWGGNAVIGGIAPNGVSGSPLPVELTSFTASTQGGNVTLNWKTATELNNYGFEVERKALLNSSESGNSGEWRKIGFVEGHGNSNSPKSYSFTDKNISGSSKFYYRLKQIDNDGQFEYSDIVEVDLNIPAKFVLEQNYPNPFNPSTTIRFAFEKSTFATLKVYNAVGEEVAELFKGTADAGRIYSLNFDASVLSSGVYFYKLTSGKNVAVKKMILLR